MANTTKNEDIQKQPDGLGILNIEAECPLSTNIIQDAIHSTRKLLDAIDLDEICDEIIEKEKQI
ncbi:hypothetical protein DWQ65_03565 [Treponema phagedenis]|uniref:hypothetical protein n=1 Tax=Treponema phagedenis TaxID=162 RepID=UPI0001F63E85|nr:hypothetical protein [Treponema phagedenis]EFW37911.1 hypothetical protein HMPREF9554_01602 [Treponema phagedenis F0421]QSH99163.1 hypothetical protein DWQ65_03565 [Treponema phagedenis]TYT79784.1 hypothetical protein FS559_12265 [Treponema phagedenis]